MVLPALSARRSLLGSTIATVTPNHKLCSLLQKQLCDKLQEQLQNLDAALKKKERAERRQDELKLLQLPAGWSRTTGGTDT